MLYNHLGELLEGGWAFSGELALCLLLNGACFHMQSVMAYAVMGLISPVSQARARLFSRPRGRPDLQSRVGTFSLSLGLTASASEPRSRSELTPSLSRARARSRSPTRSSARCSSGCRSCTLATR